MTWQATRRALRIPTIVLVGVFAFLLGLGIGLSGPKDSKVPDERVVTKVVVQHDRPEHKQPKQLKGDDNHDGVIDEDESGWNCHTMGNKQCGQR